QSLVLEITFLLLFLHRRRAVVVDDATLAFGAGREQHLLDDLGESLGAAFDRPGQWIASQGTKAYPSQLGTLALHQWHAFIVHHDQRSLAPYDRPRLREVQRNDRYVLEVDVLPDTQFGPVGQGEYTQALALVLAGVVQLPQFGTLPLRVPSMLGGAKREDPFLGAGFLLVAPRAAERSIEAILVQRLFQALGLHYVRVHVRALHERIDAAGDAFGVDVHQQLQPEAARRLVAKFDHFAKFPGGVDMQQGEGRFGRIKRFQGQVQHDGAVLADGIKH